MYTYGDRLDFGDEGRGVEKPPRGHTSTRLIHLGPLKLGFLNELVDGFSLALVHNGSHINALYTMCTIVGVCVCVQVCVIRLRDKTCFIFKKFLPLNSVA